MKSFNLYIFSEDFTVFYCVKSFKTIEEALYYAKKSYDIDFYIVEFDMTEMSVVSNRMDIDEYAEYPYKREYTLFVGYIPTWQHDAAYITVDCTTFYCYGGWQVAGRDISGICVKDLKQTSVTAGEGKIEVIKVID
jgi:hypothetical protein